MSARKICDKAEFTYRSDIGTPSLTRKTAGKLAFLQARISMENVWLGPDWSRKRNWDPTFSGRGPGRPWQHLSGLDRQVQGAANTGSLGLECRF
jgi:hypothetical protein